MDQRTRIDLTMMSLELRLAARLPVDLVAQRLTSQRLNEIAEVLEQVLEQQGGVLTLAHTQAANDKTERAIGAEVVSLVRRG